MLLNPSVWVNCPVKNFPEHTCLKYKGGKYTYSELNERANKLAWGLMELGISKGTRVATLHYNSPQSVELFLAMWKTGIVQVPLNTRNSAKENLEIINDYKTNVIIFGSEFIEQIEVIKEYSPNITLFICHGISNEKYLNYEDIVSEAPSHEPNIEVDEDDPYKIHYTSGTTGQPRGVVMTYRNRLDMVANFFINSDFVINEKQTFLHIAPLTHAAGYIFIPFYLKGARHIVLDKFDSDILLETIQNEEVTCTLLIPTMIVVLLENKNIKKYDLSTLKRIYYAAAPMPLHKLKEVISIFGNIFQQNYGLTEAVQPNIALNANEHILNGPEKIVKHLRSAGKRVLGREIRIVDDCDRDVPIGEVGEIIIRGPHVSPQYLNLPEITKEIHRGGWLHTGDLAYEDEDGYIYIVDRKKDMIISGGFNIYCREVEIFLDSHPSVLESAVVGKPDDKWGEIVQAFVVLKECENRPTEQDLIEFCASKGLTRYKLPRKLCFIDELPKNENRKIMKRQLEKDLH